LAVALIAVIMAPAGVQATFFPRSFFDDFPLGRGWISTGGDAYNEHLVRDVGALFLALIAVTAWTVWRRSDVSGVAAAWLLFGVLHLVHHSRHLDSLATGDTIALTASLVVIPLLAVAALIAERRDTRRVSGNEGSRESPGT
jgi:hypothetical protein